MKHTFRLLTVAIALATAQAHAMTDAELKAITEKRLLGDRTDACFAVAVIDKAKVARAYVCANPKNLNRISANSAFEIGSVTKTMAAVLLADLVLQGKVSLEDPISQHLPKDTLVPNFEGKPVLLKHIVTHTSALPVVPDFSTAKDANNPYAQVTEASLLKTLSEAKLSRAPGTQFEYSNYAMMLLTSIIAKKSGTDFETLLKTKLFSPIGMNNSYINQKPKSASAAQGHTPNTKKTPAWTFVTNTAGVGGVRATLDDMVSYVQANLDIKKSTISPALQLTHQIVKTDANQKMGMNWMTMPLDNRTVYAHEGGTQGFSAYTAFDQEKQRGVVVLSDTSLTTIGSLGSLGNHLLDRRIPLGNVRKNKQPEAALLDALVGKYDVLPGMQMTFTQNGNRLFAQATGQEKFELAYDSEGDFYPLDIDALIRPQKRADGSYSLLMFQGGGAFPLKKVDANNAKKATEKLTSDQLQAYVGTYNLAPGFDLKVFIEKEALMAQATGQGSFEVEAAGKDRFSADAYGIAIEFKRDAKDVVTGLSLLQGGQATPAKKQ
jgi:serine-type D-Ala-D-Ala carboxypeptidase/endopeptidase